MAPAPRLPRALQPKAPWPQTRCMAPRSSALCDLSPCIWYCPPRRRAAVAGVGIGVGIGRPACKADVAQYVLDTFHRADQEAMRPMIASIVEHAGELPAALEDAAARSRLLNALSRPAGAAGSAEGREGSRSQKRAIDAASAATGASAPGTVAEDAGTAAASTSGVSTGGPAPADVAQGPSLEPPAKQREQSWGAQSLMGALSSPADDSELHVAPGVGAISPGRAGAGAVTGQDEHHEERKPQVEIQSSDEPPAAAQGGKP